MHSFVPPDEVFLIRYVCYAAWFVICKLSPCCPRCELALTPSMKHATPKNMKANDHLSLFWSRKGGKYLPCGAGLRMHGSLARVLGAPENSSIVVSSLWMVSVMVFLNPYCYPPAPRSPSSMASYIVASLALLQLMRRYPTWVKNS